MQNFRINNNENNNGLHRFQNRINFIRLGPNNAQFFPREIDPDFIMFEQPESNTRFLLGFLIGLFIGLYALIILSCCNLRPKFKSGLKCGMIIGTFIFLVYNLMQPNKLTHT